MTQSFQNCNSKQSSLSFSFVSRETEVPLNALIHLIIFIKKTMEGTHELYWESSAFSVNIFLLESLYFE